MKKTKSIVGNVYGRWTVLKLAHEKTSNGKTKWLCQCECGNTKIVARSSLISGNSKSCGCLHKEIVSQTGKARLDNYYKKKSNSPDMTKKRFGYLPGGSK